jgi:hypothetical protein
MPDMINPQMGIDIMNNTSIINRILFAFTIFQQSPPLLDTSDMVEQATPTELNPDCMEQATTDQIMDTHIKRTRQQRIPLYQVVKAGQLLHQGKWLTRDQV